MPGFTYAYAFRQVLLALLYSGLGLIRNRFGPPKGTIDLTIRNYLPTYLIISYIGTYV